MYTTAYHGLFADDKQEALIVGPKFELEKIISEMSGEFKKRLTIHPIRAEVIDGVTRYYKIEKSHD